MKGSIIILAFVILSLISMSPQTTTVPLAIRMDLITRINLTKSDYIKPDDKGERVGQLIIEINPYDLRQTSSGQYYIYYKNSRLTEQRKYLGWAFGTHIYEGNTVFFSSDTTKAWIWTVDRYGQIFKMDLPESFANDARVIK